MPTLPGTFEDAEVEAKRKRREARLRARFRSKRLHVVTWETGWIFI